ncbi:hypothetical protein TthAA22_02750 [Thermus thermophilus]|nr:hypothetical protein TthAA22_02750 [Thermus thermophilus]
MAKAATWSTRDAEARKRGEQTGFLRVLLDPNPWGVKKEGVPCSKIVNTPFTILTQRPFSWLPTSG